MSVFFGIIFVVAGHCSAKIMFLDLIPYGDFHVPLFLFIAGYFFNVNRNFTKWIKKKTIRLVIPFFVTNIIYRILCVCLANYGFNLPKSITIYSVLIDPLVGNTLSEFNSPAWFLMPLLYIEMFFAVCNIFVKKHNYLMYFVISFFIGIIAMTLAQKNIYIIDGQRNNYLVQLLRVLILSPYFYFGRIYASFESDISLDKRIGLCIGIITMMVIVCIIFPEVYENTIISYKPLSFANYPVLNYFCGIVGIMFWIQISKIISPSIGRSRVVAAVGGQTYSIMTHHLFGFFITNALYVFIIKITGGDFDSCLEKFKEIPRMAPFGKGALSWAYVMVGVTISLLINMINQKFCNLFRNKCIKIK